MAGIGFELRRMIDQRDGFVARVRAYACAGLISSGPWIMTILTLTLLSLAGPYVGGESGYKMFRALVTYAFAFSLILQGVFQMAVTRRVADHLYGHEYERVLPAFTASLVLVGAIQAVVGGVFAAWAGFGPALSVVAVSLYVVVSLTWLALVWLSVTREYDEVLRAYVYGTLVSILALALLGLREGTTGLLAAYTAGQALILAMLVRTILRGMESGGKREWSIVTSLSAFPQLVGVGLFYNAAIWVDKVVFWFMDGIGPHPMVRYHPLYDTCNFLAYLTVVPALAVNLVRLETSFYEHYRAYYGSILGGTPLAVIEDRRHRMLENLRESTVRLLRVQGAITIAGILFAAYVIDLLQMPPIAVRIFRLTALGAFFHVLLLITILMQLYFDFRLQALTTSLVFLLLNGVLAAWSVMQGVESYGVGYAIAAFLSLLLGYSLLHRGLEKLDFLTFTNQPLGGDAPPEAEITQAEEDDEDEDDDGAEEEEREEGAVAPDAPEVHAGEFAPAAAEAAPAPAPAEEPPAAAPEPEPLPPVLPTPRDPDATFTELWSPDAAELPQPEPEPEPPAPPREEPATHTEMWSVEAALPPSPPEPEEPAEAAEDLTASELFPGDLAAPAVQPPEPEIVQPSSPPPAPPDSPEPETDTDPNVRRRNKGYREDEETDATEV